MDEDREDIRAALEGDESAYERLVRRHEADIAKRLWRFSRNPAVCEELLQDVFVEAYRGLKNYRGDAPFTHWLARITTRVGYHHWEARDRRAKFVPLDDADGAAPPPDTSVDDADEARRTAETLHGLLARLPMKERLVLTLLYFEECGTEEIAARMGWTRPMVKMRALRARRRLKAMMEAENILPEWQRRN